MHEFSLWGVTPTPLTPNVHVHMQAYTHTHIHVRTVEPLRIAYIAQVSVRVCNTLAHSTANSINLLPSRNCQSPDCLWSNPAFCCPPVRLSTWKDKASHMSAGTYHLYVTSVYNKVTGNNFFMAGEHETFKKVTTGFFFIISHSAGLQSQINTVRFK